MIGRLRGRLDGRVKIGCSWMWAASAIWSKARRGYWTDARPTVRQCRWQSKLMCAKTSFGYSVF